MSFVFGKIYRYGMVGILLCIGLTEAAIFLASTFIKHYCFNQPMPGTLTEAQLVVKKSAQPSAQPAQQSTQEVLTGI
jgi:predicted lipid-binding transport protein (Tim44 family)